MSRLGAFGLGSYYGGLSDALLQQGNQAQRRDRSDYSDRDRRVRDYDSRRSTTDVLGRRDDYRLSRDISPRRNASRSDRFSPNLQRSFDSAGDRQHGNWTEPVSYPLSHIGLSRSADRNQDRGHNQNRNRNRNTGRMGGNRGPANQGPGILGAKPGDRLIPDIPPANLHLPGVATQGLTAQIAQQQQQLMAMVQTQSLLAAMQAQAQGQFKHGISMLPTPLTSQQNRMPNMNQQRQMNRKRPMSHSWGDGGGPNKRDRFQSPQNRWQNRQRQRQKGGRWSNNSATSTEKKKPVEHSKVSEPEEQKEDKEEAVSELDLEDQDEREDATGLGEEEGEGDVESEEMMAEDTTAPEEDQTEPEKVLNFAGEDVDALMVSLFDDNRKKFICQGCKIICIKEDSFRRHLMGRRHVSTVMEKAGQVFELEEFKKYAEESAAKAEKPERAEQADSAAPEQEEASAPETQVASTSEDDYDFVKYTFDMRKTAVKEADVITISSVTKARVRITGFTSGRNMYGCEFVKAVSGFNCRLCKAFIRCGNDVSHHIKGKKHQRNYQTYVKEHPDYEENQKSRNRELDDVLAQRDGQEVVLYEVLDEDGKKPRKLHKDSQHLDPSEMQVIKFVLAPKEDEESLLAHTEEAVKEEESLDIDVPHDTSDLFEQTEDTEEELLRVHQLEDEDKEEQDEASLLDSPKQTQVKTEPLPEIQQTHVKTEPLKTEEEEFIPLQEPSPTTRRARRGGVRQGTGRGRGRGRGARRSNRAKQGVAAKRGAMKQKEEVAPEADSPADEIALMEGFEVIDEIGEAEEE